MELFSNHEIALGIFILTIGIFICWSKTRRDYLKKYLKLLLVRRNFVLGFIQLAYISIGLLALHSYKIWDLSDLKDTILWFLTVGLPVLVSVNNVDDEPRYFKRAIILNFQLSVLLEFLLGLYSFSLPIEILALFVSLILIIVAMLTVTNERYQSIHRVAYILLISSSIFLVGYPLYKIFSNIEKYFTEDNARSFLSGIFLSIWILPFVYVLHLYINYDLIFRSVNAHGRDEKLTRFAKWQALIRFNFDLVGLRRWNKVWQKDQFVNRQAIVASIKRLKQLQSREHNPTTIAGAEGWTPTQAREFLMEEGIVTDYYAQYHDGEWLATSPFMNIDKEISQNTISYTIEGTELAVKRLTLNFDQHFFEDLGLTYPLFVEMCQKLTLQSTKGKMSSNLLSAINSASDLSIQTKKFAFSFVALTQRSGRREFLFQIENLGGS